MGELEKNNDKVWFEANRSRYEAARDNFKEKVGELINDIGSFDPDIALLETKNCVFRQNRDIRFSKDKRPYKNNFGAYFNRGGKKINTASYYLHLEPGKSIFAGGLYDPDAAQLARVRQEIDYNLKEWMKILKDRNFKKNFPSGLSQASKLSRPPKGYEQTNPALEFLKLKSFTAATMLTNEEVLDKKFHGRLIHAFKSLKPMLDFLNEAAL